MSIIQAVYTPLQTWAATKSIPLRYPYMLDEKAPYLYFFQVDGDNDKPFFCDTDGGLTRFQFGYVSNNFQDCVDILEEYRAEVLDLRGGSIAGYNLFNIVIDGIRDLTGPDQADRKLYHRTFDALITWSAS